MIARVYINTGNLNIDKLFDYEVPASLEGKICVGIRVKVPFGAANHLVEAYVVHLEAESGFHELKAIKSVSDDFPVLNKTALELCEHMRSYYFCTFAEAARTMIPPGSNTRFEEWICLAHGYISRLDGKSTPRQQRLIRLLEEGGGSAEMEEIKSGLGKNARIIVNSLVEKGICEKSFREKMRSSQKMVRLAYYCGSEEPMAVAQTMKKRSPAQASVLELLAGGAQISVPDILAVCKTSRNTVESLYVKGLIDYCEKQVLRNPLSDRSFTPEEFPPLTEEQENVLKKIGKNGTYLLHGVTGSGKTEVFMNLAQRALEKSMQVIVLVPEISLTPQITQRFYNRFGSRVAVLHSALSLGERLDEWNRIRKGEASVIVGARSAIFAPCARLGAIIIDEEHEASYKSEASPRYHARDIGAFLAKKHDCPLVLASATPSVESYYKAVNGEYTLLEMTKRYNNSSLPAVSIEDMRSELKEGNKTILSRRLALEMRANKERGEQTILFLNRRGYSTFVSCRECGFVFTCPSCSVSLTYHKNARSLTCHYCGHSEPLKNVCPSCGSNKIKDFGKGTQKAQEQLEQIFPDMKILRMDADTTGGKRGHERLLDKFSHENYDVLLGTQMVAKGLDFKSVTLVGVLAADASLNVDDFRAQERTFDLITQVCGRAGRGESSGRCVVQTYMPDNKTLLLSAKQDYKAFYNEEIEYRRAFYYPPFCDIVNIMISSSSEQEAKSAAEKTALELKAVLRNVHYMMYGPSPAPVYKVMDRFRFRIWLKCRADEAFVEELKKTIHSKYGKSKSDLSVYADINPMSLN
ncbi:MAG: primosomal protein N' [Clostridia bacterium]|nr:primosomal protein N' [Clostridia bacterium]